MSDGCVSGLAGLLESIGALSIRLIRSKLNRPRAGHGDKDDFIVGRIIRPQALPKDPPLILSRAERRKHLYAIGATGCGKTNFLVRLIDNEILANRTVCVIDLRGDLNDRIIRLLASSSDPGNLKDRLCLIDLASDSYSVSLNPLQGAGDPYGRALYLLGIIRHYADSWGVQLEETIRNGLIVLSQTGWSLLEFEPLLTNQAFRQQVVGQVSDPYVQAFFRRYDELSKEQQRTWSLAALNKITPLLSIPTLRRLFGCRQGLNWENLLNDRPDRIILITLAVDRFHEVSHLVGACCVSMIQDTVMARAHISQDARLPITLVVDEFETMASEAFSAIIAEGRRFGLSLVLAHQNLSQIEPKLREVIRNNMHVQLYFQTGSLDATSLAPEISGVGNRESIRDAIVNQGVGEAFVVRRGAPCLQVATIFSPDPKVSAADFSALKTVAVQAYGRPRHVVDKELAEKAAAISGSHPHNNPQGAEFRHGKRPQL